MNKKVTDGEGERGRRRVREKDRQRERVNAGIERERGMSNFDKKQWKMEKGNRAVKGRTAFVFIFI